MGKDREKEKKEIEEFKIKLFWELGIEDNYKREVLFRIAWDYGHAYGYDEVRSYAQELVELIR